MYIVNKDNNSISEIKNKTFHELGIKERAHLQEWIAKNPTCLGEELLIIQKEFDGFDDTNERLDLLALDKNGALVVIENKLDDTGRDVTWQALKYVSYCATLNVAQIIEIFQQYLDKSGQKKGAKEELTNFFDDKPIDEISLNDGEQRIMMVAGKFRKEVTSTVMWLLDHGVSAKCFKATAFQYNGEIFLDVEQIIPVKEAEEYMIKMADKAKETSSIRAKNSKKQEINRAYWRNMLEEFNKISKQFQNVNPGVDGWLSSGSGISGVVFTFVANTAYAGVELTINRRGDKEENEELFKQLYDMKEDIEKDFGGILNWERLEAKISCRISVKQLTTVSINNRDNWDEMIGFHCDNMSRLYKALHNRLIKIARRS